MNAARFISLEGGEGAGKSTVIAAVCDWLRAQGIHFIQTREPGGTPLAEAIRAMTLDPHWHDVMLPETELLLVFAARAQHVREKILPALAAGTWVVADRFTDASFAYQGGGRGQPFARIAELEAWVAPRRPDLTFLLDLDSATGLARADGRGPRDRMERERIDFHERVRAAYQQRAEAEPGRFVTVDASSTPITVANTVLDQLAARIAQWT